MNDSNDEWYSVETIKNVKESDASAFWQIGLNYDSNEFVCGNANGSLMIYRRNIGIGMDMHDDNDHVGSFKLCWLVGCKTRL